MSRTIAEEKWRHLAGASDKEELRLNLDGGRIATTHSGEPIDMIAEPLRTGQVLGRLADVGMYARALTDGEVALMYKLSTGGTGGQTHAYRTRTPLNRIRAQCWANETITLFHLPRQRRPAARRGRPHAVQIEDLLD